jgi:hypothetical protein
MARINPTRIPRWKQAVAVACALYAIAAWVLPLLMLPFVNVLPFVHERSFTERLSISVAASVAVVVALAAINRGRLLEGFAGQSRRGLLTNRLGAVAGLSLFTFAGAALSANTLWLAAKLLPSEPFTTRASVESAKYQGSRYKSVALLLRSQDAGGLLYVVLSKRLFDYPVLHEGDQLELRGERSAVGAYLTQVRVSR